MMVLFAVDFLSVIITSVILWKVIKINVFREFQRVLESYWLFMVTYLAFGEAVYISTTDINLGTDTSGKFLWINQEGWKSLMNDTVHLSNEERVLLSNYTI